MKLSLKSVGVVENRPILFEAGLIEKKAGRGNIYTFTVMAFHQTDKMAEYETNAVEREYEIQQAALKNNKLRLLRQEKGEVIEVDAPKFRAEKETELATETEAPAVEPQPVNSPDTQPVVDPFIRETNRAASPKTVIFAIF